VKHRVRFDLDEDDAVDDDVGDELADQLASNHTSKRTFSSTDSPASVSDHHRAPAASRETRISSLLTS
jgi:hypothetical protein